MAIGDVAEALPARSWTVERVLAELGLRLLAVGTGAELPGPLAVSDLGAALHPDARLGEQRSEPSEPAASELQGSAAHVSQKGGEAA
jgi:hypothetical protein